MTGDEETRIHFDELNAMPSLWPKLRAHRLESAYQYSSVADVHRGVSYVGAWIMGGSPPPLTAGRREVGAMQ